jgi:hypothetical protein
MEYHHNFKPTSHPAITTCHFTSLKPCCRIRLRTSMPSSCVATKAWLAPYSTARATRVPMSPSRSECFVEPCDCPNLRTTSTKTVSMCYRISTELATSDCAIRPTPNISMDRAIRTGAFATLHLRMAVHLFHGHHLLGLQETDQCGSLLLRGRDHGRIRGGQGSSRKLLRSSLPFTFPGRARPRLLRAHRDGYGQSSGNCDFVQSRAARAHQTHQSSTFLRSRMCGKYATARPLRQHG